jgi:hypothetical protein
MKFTKLFFAALATVAAVTFTSCNDDDNVSTYTCSYTFEQSDDSAYDENGVWTKVKDTSTTNFGVDGYLYFGHKATYNADWDYTSWYGFCPSRATGTEDITTLVNASVDDYQWSSVTGSGVANSTDYLLGFWDVTESTDSIPANPALYFGFVTTAEPLSVYITNSNYGYWIMKKGNAYAKAFGNDDWFKITFIGVKNNAITGKVETYLAQNGEIEKTWKGVDLTPLGTVDYVYIQMSSSDSGMWGMNNPAYICLDNLSVRYTFTE